MLEALDPIRSAFTEPSFVNFLVVFGGWVLTPGRHAITETLVQTKVSGLFHHEAKKQSTRPALDWPPASPPSSAAGRPHTEADGVGGGAIRIGETRA